jgi:DNA-binding transcriptional ArsR family regulator
MHAALVQIFKLVDEHLCFGCFSCGEYGIPYRGCGFGLNFWFAEVELIFSNAVEESDARAGDFCSSEPLEAEHLWVPTEACRGFRFDVGHRSDLIPATWAGHSGVIGWVSNSGICLLVINHEEGWTPAKRELTMRQIRYTLRLASEGISARQIGRMLGVARSTIQDHLRRAQVAGLSWPLPAELTNAVLEERLFARNGAPRGVRRRAEPVWRELVCELKRPGVNLMVLWEEYRAGHPEGYSYSRF